MLKMTSLMRSMGIVMTLISPFSLQAEQGAPQKDGQFFNPYYTKKKGGFLSFMKVRLTSGKWAVGSPDLIPMHKVDLEKIHNASPSVKQATWVGHSTVLLQHNGVNILTDPVLSNHVGPISFFVPRRYTPPALYYDTLPPIHYVVISHNHYDHLDAKTVTSLGNNPKWIVPLGLGPWFEEMGITNVVELDWWEKWSDDKVRFVCTPTQHWSRRSLFDSFKTLWASWAIMIDNFSFWFAGDTGYNPYQFKEIRQRLGPFDGAAIPIGSYAPRHFMKPYHIDPHEAVSIHKEVASKKSIGIHWGTFVLSQEPIDEPPKLLKKVMEENPTLAPFLAVPVGATEQFD